MIVYLKENYFDEPIKHLYEKIRVKAHNLMWHAT